MRCIPLADDCGISISNVDAIIQCIDSGGLRGTALLACGNALEYAVSRLAERLAKGAPLLVGAHLNLFEGRCSAPSERIPLLADRSGNFLHSLGSFCRAMYLGSSKRKNAFVEQTALEWHTQVEQIRALLRTALGRDVQIYLDGHQHVHAIPALRPALDSVLDMGEFTHVRVPEELRYVYPTPVSLRIKGSLRRELLAFWGRSLRLHLRKRGVPAPDFFIGAFASGSMTIECIEAGLAAVVKKADSHSLVEIMTHPGTQIHENASATDPFMQFYTAPEREKEAKMLLSPNFHRIIRHYDPEYQGGSLL